ncbi:MAG: hypothetical protein AAGA69_12425, partial [Pseudomonadota bacterium]
MQTEKLVQVSRYVAGQSMPRHRDDRSRLTFILRGSFVEETARSSAVVRAADVLVKPRDEAHENRFGPTGAELATVFLAEEDFPATGEPVAWALHRDAEALSASLFLMECATRKDRAGVRTALSSLLAGGLRRDQAAVRVRAMGASSLVMGTSWTVRLHPTWPAARAAPITAHHGCSQVRVAARRRTVAPEEAHEN